MLKKLKRTDIEISKENLTEDFIRRAASIGGLHKIPLEADFDKFTVKNKFINKRLDGSGSITPYNGFVYGCIKYLNAVEIKLEGFDTNTVIWQNGRIQGYFETDNMQYASDPIEWSNLLLEYGFLKII